MRVLNHLLKVVRGAAVFNASAAGNCGLSNIVQITPTIS